MEASINELVTSSLPARPHVSHLKSVFGKGAARTHLAHFVEHGGHAWTQCLAFRNRLRADPAKARAYEALKLVLAAKFPDDRAAYTSGKSEFVAKVLA